MPGSCEREKILPCLRGGVALRERNASEVGEQRQPPPGLRRDPRLVHREARSEFRLVARVESWREVTRAQESRCTGRRSRNSSGVDGRLFCRDKSQGRRPRAEIELSSKRFSPSAREPAVHGATSRTGSGRGIRSPTASATGREGPLGRDHQSGADRHRRHRLRLESLPPGGARRRHEARHRLEAGATAHASEEPRARRNALPRRGLLPRAEAIPRHRDTASRRPRGSSSRSRRSPPHGDGWRRGRYTPSRGLPFSTGARRIRCRLAPVSSDAIEPSMQGWASLITSALPRPNERRGCAEATAKRVTRAGRRRGQAPGARVLGRQPNTRPSQRCLGGERGCRAAPPAGCPPHPARSGPVHRRRPALDYLSSAILLIDPEAARVPAHLVATDGAADEPRLSQVAAAVHLHRTASA